MALIIHSMGGYGRALLGMLVLGFTASAQNPCMEELDLTLWTSEDLVIDDDLLPGVWITDPDAVMQVTKSQATFLTSNFDDQYIEFEGQVCVKGPGDGFIGFALGFEPGDTQNPGAEYYLIDWKRMCEVMDFGHPSCTTSTKAHKGLALSRVYGFPTGEELWGHENFDGYCTGMESGVDEIARGLVRGHESWVPTEKYLFRFEVRPERLKVFVDDELEFDIAGTFEETCLSFYTFFQGDTHFTGWQAGDLASWSHYGPGRPGTLGEPQIWMDADPVLGKTIGCDIVSSSYVREIGILVASLNPVYLPLFGGGAILVGKPYIYIDPLYPLHAGRTTMPLAIPADPTLCGTNVYMQVFQTDRDAPLATSRIPGINMGLRRFAASCGVRLTLGR